MTLLRQISDEVADLVARSATGVVGVERRRGQGSGVVLASDGCVLTNAHVAAGEGPLRIRLPGGMAVRAELVGKDERTDLAVARADAVDLSALPLAERRRLRVGELVVAIGNPLGFERSVSVGVVSALYRSLPGPGHAFLDGLIQTDAAVNPGNSGGPLLDASGEVVGITAAMIPRASGLAFAVPAHTASWVAAVLLRQGEVRRPYLGLAVRGEELAPALAAEVGHLRAVRVLEVEPGTPAERASLRAGDLLVEANATPVDALDDLQRVLVLSERPDVELAVVREQERLRLTVRPDRARRAA
ncbi:MAG TPA: trypsin-like peptidase domain-containing protein [Anaeromyxobacteraceae bacterium]|nr:trypsin-like peptidase domain-containing protein [Anaeromyxobacteraceae bacterium]